ncbi:hypothetical protein Taro_043508 [Colocasia esculenta]|uniref:Protein kinase domain-containing protein n=1 Tax=Colocasia esculenta TaxID=4460 RepID=A0A843WSA5_COLES|nr:hypothetical protein [Colocasia esculenta]
MEFLLVLGLCLFAVTASAQLPSQDILALLEFKKGVNHDPTGYILQSWNEESVDFNGCPSSWNGVVCNGANVAAVVLDNLGVTADADLGVLTNLTMLMKLSMANNSISGVLFSNIAGFKSLRYLDISNNLFSGALPAEIGKLKNLQNLSLAGNNFSGSLPHSIGELSSIQSLDLSHNSFSGPLPSTLTSLRNLVVLNLSFNLFTREMPTGLQQISTLEVLDLGWNDLEGGIDWIFLMQASVVHVDLSGNSMISLSPKELKFLSDISDTLTYLNLSNNQLTGSLIVEDALPTFGRLKVLDLSYNQLSGELPGFDYAYDLVVLRLANNGFSGFVPNALLKGESLVLSELDLSANNLSGHVGMITSLTLQILNLSSNAISGELPLLTGGCNVVDLSRNQFTGNLSVIAKWGNEVEFIDLSQNQLTGPFPDATSQFLRLSSLNLSHNLLVNTLPAILAEYPKLSVLDLSFNQFNGPILTDLLTSTTLQDLYLQNNLLEGSISLAQSQSSGKKSNLQVLDLSGNHFNGGFPEDIITLTGLQVLKIAENNFSGPLPRAMSKFISLTSLDISVNHFTGQLPANLPNTLVSFNASYNDLSGVVPANLRKFPDSSFHPGNSMLQLPGSPPGSDNDSGAKSAHRPIRKIIKVVVIASCVVAGLILILLAIIVHCRRIPSRSQSVESTSKDILRSLPETSGVKSMETGGALVSDDLVAPRKASSSEIRSSDEKVTAVSGFSPSKTSHFSWSPESGESCMAENLGRLDVRSPDLLAGELHFLDDTITLAPEELSRAPAEILGRSSHGTSYKATLDNGILLTVKWLREGVAKPKKEFAREAKKFANIRHPNVVGLRGYYWGPTQHEKLILTDYISPGSLASFLYDRPGRKGPPLAWVQRLKIAVDVARGLNYLHFDRTVPHGNLKATNILLDGLDLNARVADYCLHRLMTQAGTTEQILDSGVLGYRAPELAASKKPNPSFKSDVYAFGVILLELLTGRCAGDVVSGEEGGVDLTDWVRLRVAEGRGSDCFDPAMAPEMATPVASKGMREVLGIALRCIRPVSERPGIKSVYEDLSSI